MLRQDHILVCVIYSFIHLIINFMHLISAAIGTPEIIAIIILLGLIVLFYFLVKGIINFISEVKK